MIQFGVRMQYAVAGFDLYRHVDVFQIKNFDMYNLKFSIFILQNWKFFIFDSANKLGNLEKPQLDARIINIGWKMAEYQLLNTKIPLVLKFPPLKFPALKFPPAEISAAQISVLKFPRSKFPANSSGYRILQICLKFKKCISQLHGLF